MIYWKLDNQTIRCLINKDEISQMGFDPDIISNDADAMSEFLNAIVDNSHNYIDWNTDNGVQNYIANTLPADQFLLTISCTYPEDMINQDLRKIRSMIRALTRKISFERIDEVEKLSGKEKEAAFLSLSRDLKEVCSGNIDDLEEDDGNTDLTGRNMGRDRSGEGRQEGPVGGKVADIEMPPQKITFAGMKELMDFCSVLDERYAYPSSLYRLKDTYVLLVDFEEKEDKTDIIRFLISVEEYGGVYESSDLSGYYVREHGELLIGENAIGLLLSMAR